jgi:hypothetical protein
MRRVMSSDSPRRARRTLATVLALALLAPLAVPPVLAQQMATFSGGIIGPDGSPAEGFLVVFRDVDSGKEFTSAKAGPSGEYTLSVPVGGRYQLAHVVAPDGSKLAVQSIPPIAVRVAGNNRLDVRFVEQAAPKPSPAPVSADSGKRKGGAPWWKKPGGIIGIVAGAGVLAALAASGGGGSSNPPVSPSAPASTPPPAP